MSSFVIRGGRVIDPANGTDAAMDLAIEDGVIVAEAGAGAEVVDAKDLIVAPGFVDLHTHLREPGREDEETIASASEAAITGGFTTIHAMPNTDPVADSSSVVEKVWAMGREVGLVDVRVAGALSRGLEGREMADIGEMARSLARVVMFTDDGKGVQDSLFVRRVMEYLVTFDAIYAEHCEDAALASDGQMNEGSMSESLGLSGVPAEAEELMAARDIALARLTGCRLHLLHVSTKGAVDLIRRAKADGLRVTAEATPHHFSLTDEALSSYDPLLKVNPPLRTEVDRAAIIDGLKDGTIDAIATDHAPHADHEKDQEFSFAPPGMVGLETALALTITELVDRDHISLYRAVELLSTAPGRILGSGGSLSPGSRADVVVFDPSETWTVDRHALHSKSRNTPFHGRTLSGRVRSVFSAGRPVLVEGKLAERIPA
ncbi:MAG: dihydroorotase [Actinomycetota bacterium]|nr:dihydroorotase [Actinomycetota bacterium]